MFPEDERDWKWLLNPWRPSNAVVADPGSHSLGKKLSARPIRSPDIVEIDDDDDVTLAELTKRERLLSGGSQISGSATPSLIRGLAPPSGSSEEKGKKRAFARAPGRQSQTKKVRSILYVWFGFVP